MAAALRRSAQELAFSRIQIIVERNLGFEAEHIERALKGEENVIFYRDQQAGRTGVLTTENIKLAAMTMTNVMLREKRVHILGEVVSQARLSSFSRPAHTPDSGGRRTPPRRGAGFASSSRSTRFSSRRLTTSSKRAASRSAARSAGSRTTSCCACSSGCTGPSPPACSWRPPDRPRAQSWRARGRHLPRGLAQRAQRAQGRLRPLRRRHARPRILGEEADHFYFWPYGLKYPRNRSGPRCSP
jgi:hypothetical protein